MTDSARAGRWLWVLLAMYAADIDCQTGDTRLACRICPIFNQGVKAANW
jgi:hypothetical protein